MHRIHLPDAWSLGEALSTEFLTGSLVLLWQFHFERRCRPSGSNSFWATSDGTIGLPADFIEVDAQIKDDEVSPNNHCGSGKLAQNLSTFGPIYQEAITPFASDIPPVLLTISLLV